MSPQATQVAIETRRFSETVVSEVTIREATRASDRKVDGRSIFRGGSSFFQAAARAAASASQLGTVRSAVIVVNELAPRAASENWRELFRGLLGAEVELSEVRVRHFDGARAAAEGAAAWGADVVIAVGGDGTVNACVNGLGTSRTRLAVVPAGTANDLSCLIGEGAKESAGLESMPSWRERDIDGIDVNGIRYYSAGGLGWVADVAATANRWRTGSAARRWLLANLFGSLIYTIACMFVILFSRRLGAHLKVTYTDAKDGSEKTIDQAAYGMLVANSNRVGSSFTLAPDSRMDDGAFELIVFPKVSRVRLLLAVIAAQRGKLLELPEMNSISVTSASIECDADQLFFGDGETLSTGRSFQVGIAATPVRLMAPATDSQLVGAQAPVAVSDFAVEFSEVV